MIAAPVIVRHPVELCVVRGGALRAQPVAVDERLQSYALSITIKKGNHLEGGCPDEVDGAKSSS
jgi:hypothetical protein